MLRIVLTSFAAALVIVCAVWLCRFSGPANDILLIVFWPAYSVAIGLSDNPHNMNAVVVFVAQLIEVFAIVLLLLLVVRLLRRPRPSAQRE